MLIVEFDLDLPSVLNLREHHFARARRVRLQREATRRALRGHPPPVLPVEVLIVRIGARHLDTGDNLAAACKAVRDAVGAALGVDDGPASPVTWRYLSERTTERHKVPVRRGRAVCGYKLVTRGRVRLEVRALPGEQGPDGRGGEGLICPAEDALTGEGGSDRAKGAALRAELACAQHRPALAVVYLEAHTTLGHARPERHASGPLAASLLGLQCAACASTNERPLVAAERVYDARQQSGLGRVLSPYAVGRRDLRAEGPHQRLDGRSHHDVARQPAALGHDDDARAERLDIGQRAHEPRPRVRLACPRYVVDVPRGDRHALTCRPAFDVGPLSLEAVGLVGRRRPQRRNRNLGIAGLRNAFRHAGETHARRRYSRNCCATNGEQQNLATRRVMDHAESLNSQL